MRIDLHRSSPPIWRRLQVNSDISLHTLHLAIQGAFDWADAHLYRFALGHPFDQNSEMFLCRWDVEEGESEGLPATDVRLDEALQQPGDLLQYVYDYGDDWGLRIRLKALSDHDPEAPDAVCTGGRRAGPPEDCGSRRTAEALAEILDNPARFDIGEANELIADYLDPDSFSLQHSGEVDSPDQSEQLQLNPAFRDLVHMTPHPLEKLLIISRLNSLDMGPIYLAPEADPFSDPSEDVDTDELDLEAEFHPVLWLLNRVGEGVQLTQAGYLPPTIAREFAAVLHSNEDLTVWTAGSESHLRQLAVYRKYLLRLGLLRKSRGVLRTTKAGAAARREPAFLWNHLVDRFADALSSPSTGGTRDFERDAAALTLLHAATSAGELDMEKVTAELSAAGWGHQDGSPIRLTDITWGGACPAVLFWFMGPREEHHWHARRIRPSAIALAHAALMRGQQK